VGVVAAALVVGLVVAWRRRARAGVAMKGAS
jgi:hypothetical protein